MAGPVPDYSQMVPSFEDYLSKPSAPLPPPDTPPATGTGNWFGAGVGARMGELLSQGGRFAQTLAQAVGADNFAQSAGAYAQRQQAAAQSFARPDLEENPWSLPGIGYQLAKGLPGLAAAAAGGGAGEVVGGGLGAFLGAAGAMYPSSVGGNAQRQIDETGALTSPGKALLYGVPEAGLQAIVPARIEHMFAGDYAGKTIGDAVRYVAKQAGIGAAAQVPAAAATTYLTQQMGDPNRPLADRANEILQSALGGAVQGAVFGGVAGGLRAATSALVSKPAASVPTSELDDATRFLDPQAGAGSAKGPDQFQWGKTNYDLGQFPPGQQVAVRTQGTEPSAQVSGFNYVRPPDEEAPPINMYGNDTPEDRMQAVLRQAPISKLFDTFKYYEDAKSAGQQLPDDHALVHQMIGAEIERRFTEAGGQPSQGTFDFTKPSPQPQQGAFDLRGGFAQGDLFGDRGRAPPFTFGEPDGLPAPAPGEPAPPEAPTADGRPIQLGGERAPPRVINVPPENEEQSRPFRTWTTDELVTRANKMANLVSITGSERTRARAQQALGELGREMKMRTLMEQDPNAPRLLAPSAAPPSAPVTPTPPDPGFDWPAYRQATAKGGNPVPGALRGKTFGSEAEVLQHIADTAHQGKMTDALAKWGFKLGVTDKDGTPIGKYAKPVEMGTNEPLATPPGLEDAQQPAAQAAVPIPSQLDPMDAILTGLRPKSASVPEGGFPPVLPAGSDPAVHMENGTSRSLSDFDTPGPEKVIAPANLAPDGTIQTAPMHAMAFSKTIDRTGSSAEDVAEFMKNTPNAEGFITSKGRYVTREEALNIANDRGQTKVAGQATNGRGEPTLISEGLGAGEQLFKPQPIQEAPTAAARVRKSPTEKPRGTEWERAVEELRWSREGAEPSRTPYWEKPSTKPAPSGEPRAPAPEETPAAGEAEQETPMEPWRIKAIQDDAVRGQAELGRLSDQLDAHRGMEQMARNNLASAKAALAKAMSAFGSKEDKHEAGLSKLAEEISQLRTEMSALEAEKEPENILRPRAKSAKNIEIERQISDILDVMSVKDAEFDQLRKVANENMNEVSRLVDKQPKETKIKLENLRVAVSSAKNAVDAAYGARLDTEDKLKTAKHNARLSSEALRNLNLNRNVSEPIPEPSPAAKATMARIDQRDAREAPKRKPFKNQAEADAARKAPPEPPKPAVDPRVSSALNKANASLDELKAVKLEASKQAGFDALVKRVNEKFNALREAIAKGDTSSIDPDAIMDDHGALFDHALDKNAPQSVLDAVSRHSDDVSALLDQLDKSAGKEIPSVSRRAYQDEERPQAKIDPNEIETKGNQARYRAIEKLREYLHQLPLDDETRKFYDRLDELQMRLVKPTAGTWKAVESATKALKSEIDAYQQRQLAVTQSRTVSRATVNSPSRADFARPNGRVDQNDVDLYNVIKKAKDSSDVLQHLAENGSTPIVRQAAAFLARLGINPKIRFARPDSFKFDNSRAYEAGQMVDGSYNPKLDRINIYNPRYLEQTLMHEFIHAATVKALRAGGTAARMMIAAFERTKRLAGDDQAYGLSNVEEFVAEVNTNPTFQNFMRSLDAPKGFVGNMMTFFKRIVGKLLKIPEYQQPLVDHVLDLTQVLAQDNVEASAPARGEEIPSIKPNPNFTPASPANRADEAMKEVSDSTDVTRSVVQNNLRQLLTDKSLNFTSAARKFILGWVDGHHIDMQFSRVIPAIHDFVGLLRDQGTRDDIFARIGVEAKRAFDATAHATQELVEKGMALTAQDIDWRKTWSEHQHLHGAPNEAVLMREVNQANRDYSSLGMREHAGGMEAYETIRAKHSAEYHMALFNSLKMLADSFEGGIPGITDKFGEYVGRPDAYQHPAKAEAFWKDAVAQAVDATTEFQGKLTGSRTELRDQLALEKQADAFRGLTPEQLAKAFGGVKPDLGSRLVERLKSGSLPEEAIAGMSNRVKRLTTDSEYVKEMLEAVQGKRKEAERSPYFHLGRTGSHFVSGKLFTNPDGSYDQSKVNQFRAQLDKAGFGDADIKDGNGNAKVYIRVRDAAEAAALRREFLKAQQSGLLDKNDAVGAGPATDESLFNTISPAFMRRAIEQFRAKAPPAPPGVDPAAWERSQYAQLRDMQQNLLNMLPETSMGRLMARRENVQGFSKDMMANSTRSSAIMSKSISRLSLAAEVGRASAAMMDQVKAANHDPNTSDADINAGSQAVGELLMRERLRQTYTPPTPLDALRHLTHALHIGSSPAYVLTLMSQLLTTTLPEFGKTHGYARGAQMMFNSSPMAFKVMRAIASSPDWATAGISQEALEKGGVPPAIVKFIMGQVARGDFGNAMYSPQMLAGHEEGGFVPEGFRKAMNVLGFYGEMWPRLVTALAARDLHNSAPQKSVVEGKQLSMEEYVSHAIKESQGDWTAQLNARQVTRGGSFGAMSPMINQFMGWQIKMTGKLYREAHAMAGGDAQSAKWMAGHLAAVTFLAGSIGLPLLSVMASVYDRLADFFTDSDDHDITASYRTFLSNTFGKDMGEIIARGAPRAIGMDFDHWGEGTIVPGSATVNALFEKRKLEDAEKDWLKSMGGSSIGELMTLAGGVRDITNGDYLDGLIKMVPEFMKTPMEGFRLAQRNFVDKNGSPLPISANGWDVALTVMGIDPQKEAEYDEVKKEATGLNTMRQLNEQNITRHLMLAQQRGDPQMFQEWMAESQRYAQAHPGLKPPIADFGRAFAEHIRAAMLARGQGLPIGVQPRDIAGRGMLSYGNFGQQ
jgi:hypothetical protein